MPIADGQQAGDGDNTEKLPVVRKGEDLQTWLRRSVLVLVQQRGLSEEEANAFASEAWHKVNGEGRIAGEQPAPPPAQAPTDEAAAEEEKQAEDPDAPQPQDDKPAEEPPAEKPAEPEGDKPAAAEAEEEPEEGTQPQTESGETSPESESEAAAENPDDPQPEMDWEQQSTWDGAEQETGEEEAQPAGEDPEQADFDMATMTGEATGEALPQAGSIVEWFASQIYGFADTLAAHLVTNGLCDERQAQELVMAASNLSDDFNAVVNARLQQPQVTQFSFTVPLPDPAQFAQAAGNLPLGTPGKAYRAPHYGRQGTRGGSAPRAAGKERVDTPEFREKVDGADNKLYDEVIGAFENGAEVGFSYHPVSQQSPSAGFALLPYPERSKVYDAQALEVDHISQYMINNAEMWGDKNHYLGGWLDSETGKFYLDVSIVVQNPADAEHLTRQHKERAYFDISKGETVFVTSLQEHENRQIAKAWVAGPDVAAPYIKRFETERHLDAGLAIKALKPGRVGAYLCLWGNPAMKDLSGEWFAPDTQEMTSIFKAVGVLPAIYHHAMDDAVKSTVVGLVDVMDADETGLWIEAQIKEHEAYKRLIAPLVDQGLLGWSSGALPGARRVNKATGKITRWPIVEASMTPAPMEWRMAAKWPIQHIKGIYRLAGLPVQAVENLFTADARPAISLDREMELIRLLEMSNNDF